jgi:hypothetical protein
VRDSLTSHFLSGDTIRTRSVSNTVLIGNLDIPVPPARLQADWEREISSNLVVDTGDVEVMPLARTRARWPAFTQCVQAMSEWTRALGLPEIVAEADMALMVCRAARYHHDVAQYGGAAFCNLFLSDDKGLDLHFAHSGHRIPLTRGTAVIFDTGQPHGVIQRGSSGFDEASFAPDGDYTQLFLTWELPIEDARLARALGVDFDIAAPIPMQADEGQVLLSGEPVTVCPETGRWR